tara:strand:- start:1527 stop:1880 length:354 start_codon:yes stop_codon:yes gene_type:complete
MVLVIWSCVFGVLAEAALVANWRILAASDAASEGIVQFVWVWPITWGSFTVLGILTLLVASGLSTNALDRSATRTAVVMILRLLAPILLVIGPGLMLMYAVVMVMAAMGATQASPAI